MKATLEFELPEEQYELNLAMRGNRYLSVLNSLDEDLRRTLKYGDDSLSEADFKAAENLRKKLHQACEEENVHLWDEP